VHTFGASALNDFEISRRVAGARLTAHIGLTAALVICALSLLGHLLGLAFLYSVQSHFAAMSPVTATACAMVAVAALPAFQGPAQARLWLCVTAFVIAALVCLSWLLTGTDQLNGAISAIVHGNVGKTSPATAAAIMLLAASLVVRRTPYRPASDPLASPTVLISGIALLGYAYGARDLYAIPMFQTMSLNTALTLLLTAVSTILARQKGGWAEIINSAGPAGEATRRQLMFLALPPLVGFLLVRITAQGQFGLAAALALLVTVTVVPLLWLILRDGRMLTDLDRERRAREADEAAHLIILEDRLAAQAQQIEAQNQWRIRQAEEASERSEDRYHRLFNSLDVGFCVIEMKFDDTGKAVDYRFIEANAAAGLSDMIGQWRRSLTPGHEQYWFDMYGAVARTGQPSRFENPARALDDRWYDVHAFPVDDRALNHVGVLFTDITARRQAEFKLQELNETLEARVKIALAESEEAHEALRQSQKMEAIGHLTGGVAHDFNNLLVPILGNLDLLRRVATTDDRQRRLIDGALQSAERAKTLVQRLLAFARRQPLQVAAVDIGKLIDDMVTIITRTTGPQIAVRVDVAPGLPPASADANQIEMAILNLSVNARDAMPDGGILTIAADTAAVTAPSPLGLAPGDYIRLSVIDSGIGMDPDTARRAVEPFFSTKGIGKGTGLGLSMVHGLASQLNGTLEIDSTPGTGTRVRLWLPHSTEAVGDAGPDETEADTVEHKGVVLVVDDEDLVRMTTAEMLRDLGYEILEASDAGAAEAILRGGERVDIVVTDHLMPGMTGAQLALLIRRTWPAISVLLISGYAEPEGVPADMPRLTKPFKREALSAAIHALPQSRA
jgi:signal transduction histidine kinase/CheY-like chemotaxis protein